MSDVIESNEPRLLLTGSLPKRPLIHQLTFRFKEGEISISKALFERLALGSLSGAAFVVQAGQFYITRSDEARAFNVRTQSQPKFGVVTVTITSKATVNYFRAQLGEPEATTVVVPVDPLAIEPVTIGFRAGEHDYPLYRLVIEQAQPKP